MSLLDWLIVLIPVCFVLYMGHHSRKYIRGVSDFLSAGRVCGRYLICVADMTNALSILALVQYVEIHYRTGFSLTFWQMLTTPVTIFMGLTGFCFYRFRETKAMSLGQFLEMRYSRSFRIFAAALRTTSEMLTNMILPAIAARFFIYFLDLPYHINILGHQVPTFMLVTILVLTIAISIICMGGTLALVITDSIQGMFCYPLLVLFAVYVLCKFSWSNEIVPVMLDRVPGESFMNPFDIENMRNFNIFQVGLTLFTLIINRSIWIGAGNSSAAKTAHEQKMAYMLGSWRGALSSIFYLLIAITIIVVLNHKNYATEAKEIRDTISRRIAGDLCSNDAAMRDRVIAATTAIPEQKHDIDVQAIREGRVPKSGLSQEKNLDSSYLTAARSAMPAGAEGNALYKQFRTLFRQMMMAMTMRKLLPPGMLGLFCLLLILAMVSTDDTRIYSSAITLSQDVVLPLIKKELTPEQHMWMIRIVAICVGIFFFIGSFFMSQLDYIALYVSIMVSIWAGGAGPVMCFGFYSRFGTTAGAFTSLITGMVIGGGGMLVKRNWADYIYPFLDKMHWAEPLGRFLERVSRPFNPYVEWHMTPVDFPINSYEITFIAIMISITLYCVVSLCLTTRIRHKHGSLLPFSLEWREDKLFNLDRMLHRGKYSLDGENKQTMKWTLKNVLAKLIGITPAYTKGDKVIAYALFSYSIIYRFFIMFILVLIWNTFISRWPALWWSNYFFISLLLIPCIVAGITAIWFGVGGFINLLQLFRDLKQRVVNPLDNGRVEGNMSLADKAQLEKLDSTGAAAAEKPAQPEKSERN